MAGGARCSSLLRGFLSLFFLMFLHVGQSGCCFSPGSASQQYEEDDGVVVGSSKRRKISPLAFSPAVSSSTVAEERARARRSRHVSSLATSLRCYIHRIFSSSSGAKNAVPEEDEAVTTTVSSSPLAHSSVTQRQASSVLLSAPSSPCASPFLSPMSPQSLGVTPVPCSPQAATRRLSRSFAARGDLFPCKTCGEVLGKPQQLELHQAMKHSLSELSHVDSSTNIIRMIFLAGWRQQQFSGADVDGEPPVVRRILRIHHNPRALARFEEYRDLVRARAARRATAGGVEEERCVADGNERLRFHCATTLCSLGGGGVCGSPYCCACTILRHGFAGKQADVDGIATYSSARAAHASLPEDVEREFAFLQVRRAMLVCRVVAGRVVRGGGAAGDGDKVGYDSMVPVSPAAGGRRGEDDAELLVFNPRAVLPCFVIMYSS
ncbi:uncharacterized protein LOC124649790 [Lolium rigidum]|uniref:uncharacterized protein LOC124649790 n=1 Tax=Lolium rigidum TaxID=89674 RepID=UPI001F5E1B22|nr:uncharacterized protein LOC124649790 [Lolium rigidum]